MYIDRHLYIFVYYKRKMKNVHSCIKLIYRERHTLISTICKKKNENMYCIL